MIITIFLITTHIFAFLALEQFLNRRAKSRGFRRFWIEKKHKTEIKKVQPETVRWIGDK